MILITVPSPFNDDQGCFSGLCDDLAEECELDTEVDIARPDIDGGSRVDDGVDEGGEDRSWVCDNPFDRASWSADICCYSCYYYHCCCHIRHNVGKICIIL